MPRKKRPSNKKYKVWALNELSRCNSLQDILGFLQRTKNRRAEILACKKTSENKNYFNKELTRLTALNHFTHQVKFLFIDKALLEQQKLINPKFGQSYRYRARFNISVPDLPNIKGYKLLQELGYYNKNNNPNGVVMDHRYSIADGIFNNVDPKILGHISNCEFLGYYDNLVKSSNSSITLDQLHSKLIVSD